MDTNQTGYALLNSFIGTWVTEGKIISKDGEGEQTISGTDTYEWLPGNFFLLHQANVFLGKEKSFTHEIIGFDSGANNFFTMHHFDNKGNSGFMTATVEDGLWKFSGEKLRFKGGFKNNQKEFSGLWEQKNQEGTWEHFIDIILTRKTGG